MEKIKPKKRYLAPRVRSKKLRFLTSTFGSWGGHDHGHHHGHHDHGGHRF